MDRFIIAMAGGFGGIAPGLIDKAHGLQSGEVAKWLANGDDLFIPILCGVGAMLLFFLIGCAVALIYRETVLSKAMILGIGAPALIMAAAAAGGKGGAPVDVTGVENAPWISRAYAQDTSSPNKAFDLTVKSVPGDTDCSSCAVQIIGKDNRLMAVQQLDPAAGETVITVPEGADSIVFSGSNTNSVSVDVRQIAEPSTTPSSKPVIDIGRDRNYWNDVQRSLGNKSVQPFDFNVTVQK